MDDFLKSLKVKEREIVSELERTPLFRQLESLRQTISTFENNGIGLHVSPSISLPTDYDPEEFTWKDRVLFIIDKMGAAGVAEIITDIQRREPNKHTKDFLDKRIGVTVSQLKKDDKIDVKRVDKKNKYFRK